MRFTSTRDGGLALGFTPALVQGLAPDGGLIVPESWPSIDLAALRAAPDLATLAARLLAPFVADDPLAEELPSVTREAFDFPLPLVPLAPDGSLAVLELFHGPTLAFKDFGARFLAAWLARARRPETRPLRILVATSGDTGGAVAAAFHRRAGFEVVVLFPKGLVSPTQERQLTTWSDNVRAFAVRGTFDDCQRMVKACLADPTPPAGARLSSANSINLGRLLPQTAYWAWAALECERRSGARASFVIPSGNLGNALACLWARRLGLPIGHVLLAHNANRAVPEFLASGTYRPRPSVATLASAMDVGDPSNLERLRALWPATAELRAAVRADSIDDDAIRSRIRADHARLGRVWCPHSAAAAEAWSRLPPALSAESPWILGATAHPAKFPEIVEPLIGRPLDVPPALAALLARPVRVEELAPDPDRLRTALESGAA